MKTNKLFAVMSMALAFAMFACNPNNPDGPQGGDNNGGNNNGGGEQPATEVTISLDKAEVQMEVGGTDILTATVTPAETPVEWTSLNEAVVTVDKGILTAIAEGTTIVLAEAGTARAQCKVVVGKGSTMGGNKYELPVMTEIYPIFLDETTLAKVQDKVVINFSVNDETTHFYPWVQEGTTDLTYAIATPTGPNFYGTDEGGYMSLACLSFSWAGGGYAAPADDINALIEKINAEPDKYFFHMGLRSTDGYGNAFYFFGMEAATKFVIGASTVYGGEVYGDFKRDGYWYEFDIPMSKYAAALSGATVESDNTGTAYIFSFLTQGINGAQLNYDALYFYKK